MTEQTGKVLSKDSLGDRMKSYEEQTTSLKVDKNLPVILRLDGVAFHTFTRGLERPFDVRLSHMMIETTIKLCAELNAIVGYTQSDEITLICYNDNPESQLLFGGKLFKLQSVIASKASVFFNSMLHMIPEKKDTSPVFDCRIWNVPTKEEATNSLVWREQDATRNSISMAAHSKFSDKQLHKKSSKDKLNMLAGAGIDWSEYPTYFKYGTYVRRTPVTRYHNGQLIERHKWASDYSLPSIKPIRNRVGYIFNSEEPMMKEVIS